VIYAFDPLESLGAPFYNAGYCGAIESNALLVRVLSRGGFRIRYRELCLACDEPTASPDTNGPPVERGRRADGRPVVRAMDEAGVTGTCQYDLVRPHRGEHPAGASVGYIEGLGVEERARGRGLGRALLRAAIAHLVAMGCASVWLTTGSENYRAQNLYFSMGFRLVDSALTLRLGEERA